MCLLPFRHDILLSFSISIALWLSWRMTSSLELLPCSIRKYRYQIFFGSFSSTATISILVELSVFNFCFVDEKNTAPFPSVTNSPLCPFISLWKACAPSRYIETFLPSVHRINERNFVCCRYFMPHSNFTQSYLLGCLIHMYPNPIYSFIS